MKAIYKINPDTGLAEITAGGFGLEVSKEGTVMFSKVPKTVYVFMGVHLGELYVSTTTAVLKGEEVDKYIKELTEVGDAYKEILALKETPEFKKGLGITDSATGWKKGLKAALVDAVSKAAKAHGSTVSSVSDGQGALTVLLKDGKTISVPKVTAARKKRPAWMEGKK